MSKFHINKHGVPAPCKANKDNCPLGGSDTHFDTVKDAQVYADKVNEEQNGLLPKVNQNFDFGPYTDEEGPDKIVRKYIENIGSYNIPWETVEDFEYDASKRKVSSKHSLDLDSHPRPEVIRFYNELMDSKEPIKSFEQSSNEFHNYDATQTLAAGNKEYYKDKEQCELASGLNEYYEQGTKLAWDMYVESKEMIHDYDADPENTKEYMSKALNFMLK